MEKGDEPKILTIIVPSYNMERDLPKCLGSGLGAAGGRKASVAIS